MNEWLLNFRLLFKRGGESIYGGGGGGYGVPHGMWDLSSPARD